MKSETSFLDLDPNKYNTKDDVEYDVELPNGLSEDIVRKISALKGEPKWMLDTRLKALAHFFSRPMPKWGADLQNIDFDAITYYRRAKAGNSTKWEDVPENIKKTFERLGIPEAERKFLAGAGTQFDSETVYHKVREDLAKQGVIFCDMDTAVKENPEIVQKYFGTVVPYADNKFAALNSAVWSGGSFVYVPKGVKVELPLQAYFRINTKNMGQFERTLIIVDEGAEVHYIEGCSAPVYSTNSLHAAVVEVIAHKNARVRYTTLQNWANNVYNLVTKRAKAYEDAYVEWLDANVGSKITMKYPCVILMGRGAKANIISVALAGAGQCQDTGAKVFHLAPDTSSTILAKSVSKDGGKSAFRGIVKVVRGAKNSKSHMRCDALILDEKSKSDTFPTLQIDEHQVSTGHEATVGKVSEDQLFYLMSRGLSEQQAVTMIVSGFLEEFVKQLPLEYAVEFNRLIELEMTNAITPTHVKGVGGMPKFDRILS